MQHHKYSLTELENMIPWEREIYITLLLDWIKKEEERQEKEALENEKKRKKLEKELEEANEDFSEETFDRYSY